MIGPVTGLCPRYIAQNLEVIQVEKFNMAVGEKDVFLQI
jgi:hypothetical protein